MLKPQDITILVDSREQTPLDFRIGDIEIPTEKATLPTADYSVKGLDQHVAVERKSLADLTGSLTSGRERFFRELKRLQAYESRLLVVECFWQDIESHKYRSKVHENSVIGSLMSIMEKHQVPILMAGDAKRAAAYTARFLFSAARRRHAELAAFSKAIRKG